jgi:hypothetical protein
MSHKSSPYNINEVKRSYFLNLFSGNAEKRIVGTKNSEFTWNIRDLQLGSIAEIGLIQLVSNNADNNTTYCIRCQNTYADGYDSFNVTSAILYLGKGLNNPEITSYHKLISNNLNSITLVITDNITSNTGIYTGIDANISFGVVLEVIDYVDSLQNF